MNRQVGFMLVLAVLFLSLVVSGVSLVRADTTIYIRRSGEVEGTNLIAREGDTYTFTANINAPIRIERNRITLDGAGYTLEGAHWGDAVNLTASYVTIKNIRIIDWSTGILGEYKNNIITETAIAQCGFGIKIYDDSNIITNSTISQCDEGIHLSAATCTISRNNLTDNVCAIKIYGNAFDQQNLITENIFANNHQVLENGPGTVQKIFHNNFINNTYPNNEYTHTIYPIGIVQLSTFCWDNGEEGNYWSNYNGTDSNNDGIGDTPYLTINNSTDRYPLIQPYATAGTTTTPTQNPTPEPTQTQTPEVTKTPDPTTIIPEQPITSEQTTPSPQPQTIAAVPTEIIIVITASIIINITLALLFIVKQKQHRRSPQLAD